MKGYRKWKIIHAPNPYAVTHLRDFNRAVIGTPNNENLQKRIDMKHFAKEIARKSRKLVRCLTKDTGNCYLKPLMV